MIITKYSSRNHIKICQAPDIQGIKEQMSEFFKSTVDKISFTDKGFVINGDTISKYFFLTEIYKRKSLYGYAVCRVMLPV